MAKTIRASLSFDTLRLEGALFLPDILERAARGELKESQSPEHYQIPKGIALQDEYGRAFQIAQAQWKAFASTLERQDLDAARYTRQFTQEFLRDVLGYGDIQPVGSIGMGERSYPIGLMARGRVPVVVAPHTLGLDDPDPRFAIQGSGTRKKSAFQLAQEFLNANPECLWALVSNGRQLRLLRDTATLTRPSYLEVDLQAILQDARYPDFAAGWRLIHASRAGNAGTPGSDCIWEQWRNDGQREGTRVREGLREGVTEALMALGEGFLQHPDNDSLRQALVAGTLAKDAYFQQLLRLVYRFIFLFTVEERGVLHGDRPEQFEAQRLYAEGYALARLRDRCLRRTGHDHFGDLWQGVRIVFKGLTHGEPRLALPALGGLFDLRQCSDLDQASLSNQALLAVMRSLRWSRRVGQMAPVDYRNMGPEELGSIYESLLELVPDVDVSARRFGFVGLQDEGSTSGNARKLSGSYYTPDSLVQELIKSALDPVIESRLAAHSTDPTGALLSIRVIDPACGSGHFLLAAARRLAERLAALRAPEGAVRPADYRHALREVIGHCIFGVDRNPMALELARTALWLEGYEEGRPLSFLDHHLICGDALIGLTDFRQLAQGIPDAAFKPLSGDDKAVCKDIGKENKEGLKAFAKLRDSSQLSLNLENSALHAELQALETLPADTTTDIAAKEAAYDVFRQHAHASRLARAADLFVGAFLAPKRVIGERLSVSGEGGTLITDHRSPITPTSKTLYLELFSDSRNAEHEQRLAQAQALCREARVLHWPLAFPQVFSPRPQAGEGPGEREPGVRGGGFDCVLGNPPWERIKLQEEEFFATRHPLVAQAKNKAERGQRIQWLEQGMLARHLYPELEHTPHECEAEQRLHAEFITTRRTAEAASVFAHLKGDDGGRYPLTGVGDVNTYALFAETISQIVSPQGRAGFLVPSGLATDNTTKDFFGALISNKALKSFFEFENEGYFPGAGQGHMLRFALTTIVGVSTKIEETRFLFQGKQLTDLLDDERVFTLSPSEIFLVNPNTRTCPIFRSRRDAEITKAIYAHVPILMRDADGDDPGHNPWGIRFMAMFHMANDSHLFKTKAELEQEGCVLDGNCFGRGTERYLPLYEAKMMQPYSHRHGDFRDASDGARAHILPTIPVERLQRPTYLPEPYYWIANPDIKQRLEDVDWPHQWLLGWRKVTDSRASARTLIFSLLPYSGAGDSLNLIFPKQVERNKLYACFVANLSTLVLDYVVRTKVGGLNLNYFAMRQFPVLAPESYTEANLDYIVPRVLELTYTATDLEPWAGDLGYEGPPFQFDPDRRAKLRAELDAYYARLYGLDREALRFILDPQSVKPGYPSETFSVLKRSEEREFNGEYRTQRLVLEAWDRLEGIHAA